MQHTDPAREYVRALRGFYLHLATYLIANLMLFVLDVLTPGGPWFYRPLLIWGIAVALNGVTVFMSGRFFDAEWENRKVEKLHGRGAHAGHA